MTRIYGYLVDDVFPQFLADLGKLVNTQLPQIVWVFYLA